MTKVIKIWGIIQEFSLFLISGVLIALFWANYDYEGYSHFKHLSIATNDFIGSRNDSGEFNLTIHYIVNDFLMAFFFAFAAKEILEAIVLKGGSLKGKKAITPIFVTIGGVVGPVFVFFMYSYLLGDNVYNEIKSGWAISTATDIAFAFLFAKIIFGSSHPAIGFILLLAIVDDAIGVAILAIFYPQNELSLEYLLYSLLVSLFAYFVLNRYFKVNNFIPYVLVGMVSWYLFQKSGLHPALGLLSMVPTMPHAETDLGVFSEEEVSRTDALNVFEHKLKPFIELILFLFGLLNAGVLLNSMGDVTNVVMVSLLFGKPFGILLFGFIALYVFKLSLPDGISIRGLFVIGCISGIGFTVALFVSDVAYQPGVIQDAAKVGALFSILSGFIAIVSAKILRVNKEA